MKFPYSFICIVAGGMMFLSGIRAHLNDSGLIGFIGGIATLVGIGLISWGAHLDD